MARQETKSTISGISTQPSLRSEDLSTSNNRPPAATGVLVEWKIRILQIAINLFVNLAEISSARGGGVLILGSRAPGFRRKPLFLALFVPLLLTFFCVKYNNAKGPSRIRQ